MKPLDLVPGRCEAYRDVATCVLSNFYRGWGLGRIDGRLGGGLFKMRWWGIGVIMKTSFMKQFQGGKGKHYLYGGIGEDLKGCKHPCPFPLKRAFTKKGQVNNVNIKYLFDIFIFSILSIFFPVFIVATSL